MSKATFGRYDTAGYLETEDGIAAYLEAVMEEGGRDVTLPPGARLAVIHQIAEIGR